MRNAPLIIALLLLSATQSACTTKPFQPPPPEHEMWERPGTSELRTKKKMLECGSPAPDPNISSYKHAFDLEERDALLNKFLLEDSCMEAAGFSHKDRSVSERCGWSSRSSLAACREGVEIPKPSAERRLTSWWCRIKIDYKYCLENAVNPSACQPSGHKNPPPECLP